MESVFLHRSLGETIALGGMLIWGLLSILVQFPSRFAGKLRSWDVVYILPFWSFFAPVPGRADFFLLCRDFLADGSATAWLDVTPWEPRRWFNVLWNPGRRDRKRFLDLTTTLLVLTEGGQVRPSVQTSLPYLTLLNYVASLPHPGNAASTQFVIIQTEHDDLNRDDLNPKEPIFTFRSGVHSLVE